VLGRSPVVDAVLSDPFYLPRYGRDVSREIRVASGSEMGSCEDLFRSACFGGGVGERGEFDSVHCYDARDAFAEVFGYEEGRVIEDVWCRFLRARSMAERALAGLTVEDRVWLVAHPKAWFFGDPELDLVRSLKDEGEEEVDEGVIHRGDDYNFFTIEDPSVQLHIFEMASRVDIAKLAEAEIELCAVVDYVREHVELFRDFEGEYVYEDIVSSSDALELEDGESDGVGVRLLIAGCGDDRHTSDYDMIIDVGGDDVYLNNAGGTGVGVRVASLCIDLSGDDRYDGAVGSLGAGFLGIGTLVDFEGDDLYTSDSMIPKTNTQATSRNTHHHS